MPDSAFVVLPDPPLAPAAELAAGNAARVPGESLAYREAREQLLAAEIELRRHIERVAQLRRNLPPGGEVTRAYTFVGQAGPATLPDLFGSKNTLLVYNFMFGPERPGPCPVCTSFMATWESKLADIQQRVSFVFVARSPIDRLLRYRDSRGWRHLPFFSDPTGDFTRDYVSPEDGDAPGLTVFTRRDGSLRHFWSGEMDPSMADPGQDPRGAPDLDPLWLLLDLTPEGRGTTWYPRLNYA